MFRSLRVRLPLLFLAGIAVAGVVTTVIAVRLFQDFAHDQAVAELTREANAIAQLYANAANETFGSQHRLPPKLTRESLERATGDRIYYAGVPLFTGEKSDLRTLPQTIVRWEDGKQRSFEFTPPGAHRKYLAVANPLVYGQQPVGAIIVAQPTTNVSDRVFGLVRRLTIAGALGLLIAAALAFWLSRRLVRPVIALSGAADEVASGRYAVDVPRGAGEIGHLSERFGEMAQRLAEAEAIERNFLMSVSHELRTPLTAIRGHVSAILEGVVDDPDSRSHSLEIVEAEAQRLERLVGDILDLAKLEAHRFTVTREEVDMETLLDIAYATFSEEARRRSIEYRREVRAPAVIQSDGDRVLQIVDNLLSNAFKHTPDGGRIQLQLAQVNGAVRVTVEDTGPGIPVDQRERVFRPFVSGDSAGGTGLGLAIARELSAALGGRIDLDSELGRGSRFELVLPV
ncbi:MAG TPA: HAMP domain-containing sensor histidine kinase [Gaiellaceae bacterium]